MIFKKNKKKNNKLLSTIFKNNEKPTMKEQIISMIYFEIIGFIFCLLILFILSGGKNYLRLYKDLNKLINVYDTITTNYYGDLDKSAMIDNAIESMLEEAGDSYTTYTNKNQTTDFLENIDSTYKGIGCTVATNEKGEVYIVSIFDQTPAKEAGLLENDIILKIDDITFEGKTSEDMAKYIKENKKTKMKILVKRNEEEKEIILTRKKIEIPTVDGKIETQDNKKIGYIEIGIFSAVTYNQFKEKLEELEKENIQGLIIDVRNNSGGYLSSVTDITSLFLKKGQIIYQLESDNKKEIIKDKTKENRKYPVAVLINLGSASASEILASAIKESYKGIIVGTNSYGKGTVQKTKKLPDGSMIKYTVEKWLTPDGNWINEKGVTPTEFVELKSSITNEAESKIDRQYEKALELIKDAIK